MTQLQEPPQDEIDFGETEHDTPRGPAWVRAHRVLLAIVGAALLIWILTGFYVVQPYEVAIVERLGKFVGGDRASVVEPGTHFGFPWPIDRVYKVAVQQTQVLSVDTFNTSPEDLKDFRQRALESGVRPEVFSAIYDPYLITGDKNIIHLSLDISHQISDPQQYIMAVAQMPGHSKEMREEMFKRVLEHELIDEIARLKVDYIMFTDQAALPGIMSAAANRALSWPDPADPAKRVSRFGVQVKQVNIRNVRPPALVAPSFNEVTAAINQRSLLVNGARTRRDTEVTRAEGEAHAMRLAAEAYAGQVKNVALGEAKRFEQLYEQYRKDRVFTRYDMYVGAVREVLQSSTRTWFVQKGQAGPVIPLPPPEKGVGPGGS